MLSARAALVLLVSLVTLLWIARPHAVATYAEATDKAPRFLENFTKQSRPLESAYNRAWRDANLTGKDDDFKRQVAAQNKIDEFLSDATAFAQVKAIKRS